MPTAARPRFNPRARGGRDQLNRAISALHNGFNPRARGGRDRECQARRDAGGEFQSTRPRGARHSSAQMINPRPSFNPRARGGRDFINPVEELTDKCFNPRARGGRDASFSAFSCPKISFQSTRPRGARPQSHEPIYGNPHVSIHAPAGGATRQPQRGRKTVEVSIHAPAGGATGRWPIARALRAVSIHAPAGGATPEHAHQPNHGCVFQSTRPRGARHVRWDGRDDEDAVSIHAPAGGATYWNFRDLGEQHVSIHAPAGGATQVKTAGPP